MPRLYDVVAKMMFAPFGGIGALRKQALDLVGVTAGSRVLELGCGTGALTKMMTERGAEVHAIDGSHQMLERARHVAPAARFERLQLEALEVAGAYDITLLAFVLHELSRSIRASVIAKTLEALDGVGRLAILDHALPQKGLFAPAWRRLLLTIEPPTVRDCIERGYRTEIEEAGGRVVGIYPLAGGTAALTLASRS